MNTTAAITIELSGPRGSAELSDLANVVVALRSCLKHLCRCLIGSDKVEYDISDLRYGSAVLVAEPVQKPGIPDEVLLEVSRTLNKTFVALEFGGELDHRLDYSSIRAISAFSSIVKKPGSSLSIGQTRLTKKFVERISFLLEPDSESLGSVTGRLEEFSIHNGNRFTLYPPIAGEEVDCIFNRNDLANVLKAVDRNVIVYGMLRYTKSKAFPVSVTVDTFDVLPDADTLPTLLNTCGSLCFPETSINQIRELRNEW